MESLTRKLFEMNYDYSEEVKPETCRIKLSLSSEHKEKKDTSFSDALATKVCNEALGKIKNTLTDNDKVVSISTRKYKRNTDEKALLQSDKYKIFGNFMELTIDIDITKEGSKESLEELLMTVYEFNDLHSEEKCHNVSHISSIVCKMKDPVKAADGIAAKLAGRCKTRAESIVNGFGDTIKGVHSLVYNSDGGMITKLSAMGVSVPSTNFINSSNDFEDDDDFGCSDGLGNISNGLSMQCSRFFKPNKAEATTTKNTDEHEDTKESDEAKRDAYKAEIETTLNMVYDKSIELRDSIKVVFELN